MNLHLCTDRVTGSIVHRSGSSSASTFFRRLYLPPISVTVFCTSSPTSFTKGLFEPTLYDPSFKCSIPLLTHSIKMSFLGGGSSKGGVNPDRMDVATQE